MKDTAKITVKIFIVTLAVMLSMFGMLYAGNWFLDAIGMSFARSKEIIILFISTSYGLLMALATCGSFYWFIPLCWKEHKQRKQEAEEERRAEELTTTGGNEHEAEED